MSVIRRRRFVPQALPPVRLSRAEAAEVLPVRPNHRKYSKVLGAYCSDAST